MQQQQIAATMANRNDNKSMTLKPNAEGKLVVNINSLDLDPDYDYTLKRTQSENFTLSKSAKAKSMWKYPYDFESEYARAKPKANAENKDKFSSIGKPSEGSGSKAANDSSAGSSTANHSQSSLPPRLLDLFDRLVGRLKDREVDEVSRSKRRIWRSLCNEVLSIKGQYISIGSLGSTLVEDLSIHLEELLREARELPRGYGLPSEEREEVDLELDRQLERVENELESVKKFTDRARRDKRRSDR